MIELLITFLVLFFVWIPVIIWLMKTNYTPRKHILNLLESVSRHQGRQREWQIFLSRPLHWQKDLEVFRQACIALENEFGTGFERHILKDDALPEVQQLILLLKQETKPGQQD